ncbi:MAG: glycosyltransferase family 4 protein, partial [Bacteroidetes bacterium]|nr:glycosyltransferase family 4 protein [Bacteroidota bacterium]
IISPHHDKAQLQKELRGEFVVDSAGLYSVRELFSLSHRANKSKVDIFHEPHYTFPYFLSVPGIVTIHDIIHIRLKEYYSPLHRFYAKTIVQHACRAAKAILVNSQFTKQELLNVCEVEEEKVHVTYLGVAKSFYESELEEYKDSFRRRFNLFKPYILYVGALKPHKNIPILFKAFSKIREQYDCLLFLAGEHLDTYPELRSLAEELNIQQAILNPGKLSQRDLRAAYQCATMLVLPSLYEGFGLPMVEAMASGIPVIGANATVIPEILSDAGYLFEPHDELDLANKIDILLTDETLRNELLAKGHERVQHFSYAQCALETKNIYKSILQ